MTPRSKHPLAATLATLLLLASCTDGRGPTELETDLDADFAISDGNNGDGVDGFYWLAPTVKKGQKTFTGTFDPGLVGLLNIHVCQGTAAETADDCSTTLRTLNGGTPPEVIRVDTEAENYSVTWQSTNGTDILVGSAYRAFAVVTVPGTSELRTLGFVDLMAVARKKDVKDVPVGYAGLVVGSNFQFKWRVEYGIAGAIAVDPPGQEIFDSGTPGQTAAYTATVLDLHGDPMVGVDVAWESNTPSVADVDPATAPTDGSGVSETTASSDGLTPVGANTTVTITASIQDLSDHEILLVKPSLGAIVVVKTSNVPGTFEFTGPGGDFTIVTTGSSEATGQWTISPLLGGSSYEVLETPNPDFDVGTATCELEGGSPTGTPTTNGVTSIVVQPGKTTTCTFTNTIKSATIRVVKNSGDDAGTFSFSGDLGDFDLTTSGGPPATAQTDIIDLDPTLTYDITETLNPDFAVGVVNCLKQDGVTPTGTDDGSGGVTGVEVEPGEITTCTFTNTLLDGYLTVVKNSGAIPGAFEFTGDLGAFTLNTSGGPPHEASQTLQKAANQTYDIFETPNDDFDFDGAVCTLEEGGSTGTPVADGVTAVLVQPGKTTICTFMNSLKIVANDDHYDVTGNVGIGVPAAQGVLSNDVGSVLTVSMVNGSAGNVGLAAATTSGGSVTVQADGSFTYDPPPGYEGGDGFTYTATDGIKSASATVTFTVATVIWFIDNSASSPGDGRLNTPFNTLAAFEAVNGVGGAGVPDPGDAIFLSTGSGPYAGGVSLMNSQVLIGEGASASIDAIIGLSPPPHSYPLPTTGGTPPVVENTGGNGITIAAGNTLRGLDVGATPIGYGLADAGGSVGTVSVSELAISGAGGLISFANGGIGSLAFDDLASTASPGRGIFLNAYEGSLSVSPGGTDIGSATDDAILIQYAGLGTFDFGPTTVAGGLDAIDLATGNTGATFTFAELDAVALAGAGLRANGGTINIGGGASNDIVATGGPALDVVGSNTGAGWTFFSLVSSNSPAEGVNLDGLTGGGVTVTGITDVDHAAAEGVELENTSVIVSFGDIAINNRWSTGVLLDDVDGTTATFGAATIPNPNGAGGYGIRVANSAAYVTFASADITNTVQTIATADATRDGVPDNEGDGDAIFLINNTGSFTLNGGLLSQLATDGIDSRNSGDLIVSGVTIEDIGLNSGNVNPTNDNGIFALNLWGTNRVENSFIRRFKGQGGGEDDSGFKVLNIGTSFQEIRINNTQFTSDFLHGLRGNRGFELKALGTVNGHIIVENGTLFEHISGDAVGISVGNDGGTGLMQVDFNDVDMRNSTEPGSFGGLQFGVIGTATLDLDIQNSRISAVYPGNANNGDIGTNVGEDGSLEFRVQGSQISHPEDPSNPGKPGPSGRAGIWLTAGSRGSPESPDQFDVIIDGNSISGTDDEAVHIDLRGAALSGGTANIQITNNTFGDPIPVSRGFEGVLVRTRDEAKTTNLLVANNVIVQEGNSLADEVLEITAEDFATVNATVTDNTLRNNGGAATFSLAVETEDAGATICLDLLGNIVGSGPAPTTGNGQIGLLETAGSFTVAGGTAGNPVTAADLLLPVPGTNDAAGVTFVGTVTFNGAAGCPLPTN